MLKQQLTLLRLLRLWWLPSSVSFVVEGWLRIVLDDFAAHCIDIE